MSACENNFQKFMCFGVNFVSDFIDGLKNNPAIKTLTDLVGTISKFGIVVIAICVICKILVWVLETVIKEYADKLPFPLSLMADVILDVYTDNIVGLLDDAKKAVPWWDQGSCAKWSSGEFSTDYTLWEGEGQININVPSYKKPAPFHNVGPDYKVSAVFNTKKDLDNYNGHVDKLCNDGGDCKMAPGANFGIFSGIGNGNAPRKFAQCCEMNYHFMADGKGTRMPIWPSECSVLGAIGKDAEATVEYAGCGVKKAFEFWKWGHNKTNCTKNYTKSLINPFERRNKCAYEKLQKIGCDKYFSYSPGYKLIPPTGLQNLLTSAGGGGQNWQGGTSANGNTKYPLGSGIDFYQAYNSYNKFINGSLVNIPVIPEQNKKEIICTGDKPPPECFGRFRPMTLQERATNQFNFMIDNIKNSPYFDVIFYPLIFLLIIYIIYIIFVEYAKSCEAMKGEKFNDIFGTCTNKTEFSGDVKKALDLYSGSVRKTASAASSAVSKIIPDKIKNPAKPVTDTVKSATNTANSATKSVSDNVKKLASKAAETYKANTN